jgi:hypothetical protein
MELECHQSLIIRASCYDLGVNWDYDPDQDQPSSAVGLQSVDCDTGITTGD